MAEIARHSWYLHFMTRSRSEQEESQASATRKIVEYKQFSPAASFAISVAACPVVCALLWFPLLFFTVAYLRFEFTITTIVVCGAIAAVPSCVAARVIYHLLRWRCVVYDGQQCPSCDYNLTGNVSGVCPECGEAT